MISRATVLESIGLAEEIYSRLWAYLLNLRDGSVDDSKGVSIISFQFTLAEAIFRLDRLCDSIKHQKRSCVRRKGQLSPSWFRSRMRTLASYSQAVEEAAQIGREIGDLFAWFFYQRDRDVLVKHLMQSKVSQIPPGLGGGGELSFLKATPVLDGHLVIYHGTTSILRIGDLSLIDISQRRVASIVELKTLKRDGDQVRCFTVACGRLEAKSLEVPNSLHSWPVGSAQAERLKRQMRRMKGAFLAEEPSLRREVVSGGYHDDLKILAGSLGQRRSGWRRAGPGLLLLAARRSNYRSLGHRLLRPESTWATALVRPPQKIANGMVFPDSGFNSFVSGFVRFGVDARYVPPFWHGIPGPLLKAVLFRMAGVITIYNLAFLLEGLRERGLEVSNNEPEGLEISCGTSKGSIRLYSAREAIRGIVEHLLKEATVQEAVVSSAELLKKGAVDGMESLKIHLQEHLGLPSR